MKIDHIGILSEDLSASIKVFESLGYRWGGQFFNDDIQQCKICFLHKDDEPKIELVQPYEDNKMMRKFLSKRGVSPYHICWEVDDVQLVYDKLLHSEGFIPLFPPVEAVAFNNRKITYFMNFEAGFLEFVNIK